MSLFALGLEHLLLKEITTTSFVVYGTAKGEYHAIYMTSLPNEVVIRTDKEGKEHPVTFDSKCSIPGGPTLRVGFQTAPIAGANP
jgi:hypothetical protein